MKEQWRAVPGFEGVYEVSDRARVRSFRRRQVRLLRPGLASNGYYTVALGRGNSRTVHSLVALAFLGPPPAGCEVRHKDGNRRRSCLTNLQYGTRSENIRDAVRHGTWMSPGRTAHLRKVGFGGR
jgi:hypothetical protein